MALTDQIKDDMICVGVTRDMARRPEGGEGGQGRPLGLGDREKGPSKWYVTHMGVGCQIFQKKALRRCKIQCYQRYVTLEWPQRP